MIAKGLTVRQYALLLALLTLVLVALVSWLSRHELAAARARIDEWRQVSSLREMQVALEQLQSAAMEAANQFANWDEVRQQLANPTYYTYWRNHRLRSSGMLPELTEDANLYAADGHSLARMADLRLPVDIPRDSTQLLVDTLEPEPSILVFQAVRPSPGEAVLGYVGIRLPLLPLLLAETRFRYVDPDSIEFTGAAGMQSLLSENGEQFRYHQREDFAIATLYEVVTATGMRWALISLAVALLLYFYLVYAVGIPLQKLVQHIERLRHGSGRQPLSGYGKGLAVRELEAVRHSLNDYQERLDEVHLRLDEKNRELWKLAHHDALTGVQNRRAFQEHWDNLRELSADGRIGLCLILFDVNHFKAINDTYGHHVGDRVLTAIAERINSQLRGGEQLYRLGGDEFCSLLLNCSPPIAREVARRCRDAVSSFDFSCFEMTEPVKISIGIASLPVGADFAIDELTWQADVAVYQAKRPGNSDIVVYSPNLMESGRELFSSWIYNAVYDVLSGSRELTLFYQPIVDLHTDRVAFYEALVRIRHGIDWINPGSILPIIEMRHLESELDRRVLQKADSDLRTGLIPAGAGLSLNLSGPTLAMEHLRDWVAPLAEFLADRQIMFEVTETALISHLASASENLKWLADAGFLVALDDFGSGYSSIRYLAAMPVNLVKFDISLTRDLEQGKRATIALSLSRMILDLGHQLVAEGIEEEGLAQQVRQAGFRYAQGYLFGRPSEFPADAPEAPEQLRANT